jgi:hypothetical protein
MKVNNICLFMVMVGASKMMASTSPEALNDK